MSKNVAKTAKLKKGQTVTINIPFTYTIGEEGYHSGKKKLQTIEDCEEEVRAELESGSFEAGEAYLEVGEIKDAE